MLQSDVLVVLILIVLERVLHSSVAGPPTHTPSQELSRNWKIMKTLQIR